MNERRAAIKSLVLENSKREISDAFSSKEQAGKRNAIALNDMSAMGGK